MREYVYTNLKIIKKYLRKRTKVLPKSYKLSIREEFKEWNENPLLEEKEIWTLPDLTKTERFDNFCRSIKKKKN